MWGTVSDSSLIHDVFFFQAGQVALQVRVEESNMEANGELVLAVWFIANI